MTNDPTLTRRRAAARGREAVARWRIRGAVWGGRLFAALLAVVSLFPIVYAGFPDWRSAGILVALSLAILATTEWLRRGSRAAALLLLGAVIAAKLRSVFYAHEPWSYGFVWTLILLATALNGVWGAFALASARRDAAVLPPP